MKRLLSLSPEWLSYTVILDKVRCLFITLSYFRPDRFVQLLSLSNTDPNLTLIFASLNRSSILLSKLNLFFSG